MIYTDPLFYKNRNIDDAIKKVKLNTLPELKIIDNRYEIHLFDDGYGSVYNTKSAKYLKPSISNKNNLYLTVGLRCVDGTSKNRYLHRLIALAFIDKYVEGFVVDHVDCDTLNNHISNLEWVTGAENTRRAAKNGLGVGRPKVPKQPKVYKTKLERSDIYSKNLSYDDVTMIFDLVAEGLSRTDIAKRFNVSQPAISQIVSGVRWINHPASIEYRKKENVM